MASKTSSAKTEAAVFLPGPEFWELWKRNGEGAFQREKVTEMASVTPERIPGGVQLVFPVLTSFAVPFWAATDDPDLLDDVGDMQLEKLGLKPVNLQGKMREFHLVDNIGKRSLAVATVLTPLTSAEYPRQAPSAFHVSPYLYTLPVDSVTVWKELGRLVLAVTRNESPVYFHALSSDEIDAAAIQEIKCILLQLRTQEVIEGVEQVVFWLGETPEEAARKLVEEELGVETRFGQAPAPVVPATSSGLVPEAVAMMRARQEQRRRVRNLLLLGAMVYLIALGVFAAFLWKAQNETRQLRNQIAQARPAADAIRETQLKWAVLRPAIDADVYPIELLSKCVQLLPPRGVRLTEFEISGRDIFLKGEASSASEAIRFKGELMNKPLLADYEWNFPQPTILQTGGATFQTKGKPKYGSP